MILKVFQHTPCSRLVRGQASGSLPGELLELVGKPGIGLPAGCRPTSERLAGQQ